MNWKEPKVFAVKHKDNDIRMASRSGGIFTALSDEILNNNGVVYGCILNDKFEAIHVRADSKEMRNRMRGSKYVQSDMGDIFSAVKKDLKENKQVMFSGTSCQIAGLKSFLGCEYDNLLCVDIVCHGVPSPLIWKSYLQWQENKNGKCIAVDFRNKKDFGWSDHVETLIMMNKNGKQKAINSQVFTKLFYGHCILRPCCYECPYKSILHPGDITIADYWGIDKAAPGFNDDRGVSLVLVNNEKGFELFDKVNNVLNYQETKIEDSLQPPLVKPFEKPENREKFWDELYTSSFDEFVRKYGGNKLKSKIKLFINKIRRGN